MVQYNFYLNDRRWGRMFVRVCPYFPFSARVCLNQHHWLANRLREERIPFQQCSNAFLNCADPKRLQQLADSLTSRDLLIDRVSAGLAPAFRGATDTSMPVRQSPRPRGEGRWAEGV